MYLYSIRKGIYAKNKEYSRLELATRMFTPSYVSFETVLAQTGLIFQYYERIFVASYTTRNALIDGQEYSYKRIKKGVLMNSIGVKQRNELSIATKECAFLDTLYINKDYYFDNLRSLNWDSVFQILPIYTNIRMEKKGNVLYKKLV